MDPTFKTARKLVSGWMPAVAMMALIFWLSSQPVLPSSPDKTQDFAAKKFAHVLAYGVLALSYLRAVRLTSRPHLLAFLLAVLYAASDELHQSTVPNRGASVQDVVLDGTAAGAALSAIGWTMRREKRAPRAKPPFPISWL